MTLSTSMIDAMDADMSWTGMIWSFVNEAVWFAAGFLLFRLALRSGLLPSSLGPPWLTGKAGKVGKDHCNHSVAKHPVSKSICADSKAGKEASVLSTWRREKGPLQLPALEAVAQALAKLEPDNLSDELVNCLKNNSSLAKPATVHAVVAKIVHLGQPDLAQDFIDGLAAAKLQASVATKTSDFVLAAFATKGHKDKVEELLMKREPDEEYWALGANAAARGFLKSGLSTQALEQVQMLQQRGAALQTSVVSALLVASCTSKDVPTLMALDALQSSTIPMEAAATVAQSCFKYEDVVTARGMEKHLRGQQQMMTFPVLEALLKLAAKHDENWALSLFQEMQDLALFLSEGLCGLVLSRCGEARHINLAEAVQKYLRAQKMTSLATYKTLMKVYATCDLLDRACSLYDAIIEDGVMPDSVMYGCLVKFAVKCGRNDLSEKLFAMVSDQPQGSDVQSYMWLIRSAGQKRDVPQAMEILRKLQQRNDAVDAAIYNCVLDVCMTNGALSEAEAIFKEMRDSKVVTLVTYNTLMKGYSAKGDFAHARKLIDDMRDIGLKPDSASFNCLISAAVSAGSYDQAWHVFEDMQKFGLEADSFTLSILMKVARKAKRRSDAQRALCVLDKSKVDVCADEVLLNTVLDACIHLKDMQRLAWVLSQVEKASSGKFSVQNYGLIIKAYSCLKRIRGCWATWQEMTTERGLIPSDVALSCMLDAIVMGGQVEEAVSLFKEWRTSVPPNTIIFSNLIKGFAASGDADRAMEMYRELRADGLQMNLVAYTTLIDAQARAGKTDRAQALLEQMEKDDIQPNTITFSSMIKGYCLKGDLDGALGLFEKMISKDLLPDTIIYNTLLDGAVRASRFSLCDQLLEEMTRSGMEASTFTISIVVKMWGKRKKLDNAFGAVRDASKSGRLQLDSKLCTCLISACFHTNAPKRALEALEETKRLKNCDGPDGGTYEQLIDLLLKAKLPREAAAMAKEAIELASGSKASIRPLSAGVLRQLRRALEQQHVKELWTPLEEQLRRARLPMP
eukprot:TRINITY_DN2978_c0_g1_i2.p1 TRINITY_DN2978_c0_g1~~TRINITY_DN2978_c0_g1_i2.p1  ORF type:complete len:1024 (+),score=262.09 TRINITY_DN2978_c0_g1_i2:145-3216(+)